MSQLNRRSFVQLSAGALISAASTTLMAEKNAPVITDENGTTRVRTTSYTWEYSRSEDIFRLLDSRNRLIVSGKNQPAVVVAPAGEPAKRHCVSGNVSGMTHGPDRVVIKYSDVSRTVQVTVAWRFDERGIWTEPIAYETQSEEDVVSLHYFANGDGTQPIASLHASTLIVPGISEGSSISPIVSDRVHLNENVWLGRGSFIPGLNQQWGLPVHYFSGFSADQSQGQRSSYTSKRSDAFTCGLADLPAGDLFLNLHEGNCSPWIDYRSDLWHHLRGPGNLSLGATLYWSVGESYYDATAGYYQGLLDVGIIHKHQNSPRKTEVLLTPQFCTWGAQVVRNKGGERLDEEFLRELHRELKTAGMKAGLFSIDDKWEGTYGNLEHSAQRFPHFEQFLDQLRADGFRVGMWAALMRCERPSDLGLTEDHVLKMPDGKPFRVDFSGSHYYILDFTQPPVAKVLSELARRYIRRYKPDLLKFDFGYELPTVGIAAPRDKAWMGERLMWKGLDVVIRAMREENPDLVVMYYNLSPLFLDYFDLHSSDDLLMAPGEYNLEENRRLFFSSQLGRLGIPTYGSSGYDWASAPDIWFDSAAIGTIGSLNDFKADEEDERATPELVARYNGITKVLRSTTTFEIVPFGTVPEAPTLGARARSWARLEAGQLVLLALRPPVSSDLIASHTATIESRVKDVVHAEFPAVVASRNSEPITRCDELAITPFGSGEISIMRLKGRHAEITTHFFGDRLIRGNASIEDGRLRFLAPERDPDGAPVEWIEIHIT